MFWLAAPLIPFGRNKGKAIDSPDVSLDDLDYQLKAAEKSIADPERAKYKAKNEAFRDALKAELARRTAQPEHTAEDGRDGQPAMAEPATQEGPDAPAPSNDDNEAEPHRARLRTAHNADAINRVWHSIPDELKQDCYPTYTDRLKAVAKAKR